MMKTIMYQQGASTAHGELPREKLFRKGAGSLRDEELLAIILRTGYSGRNVLSLARSILKKHPLEKLFCLSEEDLNRIKGLGRSKTATLTASFELAKRALGQGLELLPLVRGPKDLLSIVSDMKKLKKEHFKAIYLNARNQVIHVETVSVGHLSGSLVHPREVFAPAISNAAAGIIVAHNHPSGDPSPSGEDREITRLLSESGKILGIELLDHVIIGGENMYSMKEHGGI